MCSGKDDVLLRPLYENDGLKIHHLIAKSPPLDLNSVYSYYLFGKHFNDTCIVAEQAGELIGFISAYRIPERTDTLFVWQVVVCQSSRGQGIAWRMLNTLLQRIHGEELLAVETTVNPSNTASRGLFERLAKTQGTVVQEEPFLDATAFGSSSMHESEILLHIPLNL